jgi:hypothetical protein
LILPRSSSSSAGGLVVVAIFPLAGGSGEERFFLSSEDLLLNLRKDELALVGFGGSDKAGLAAPEEDVYEGPAAYCDGSWDIAVAEPSIGAFVT